MTHWDHKAADIRAHARISVLLTVAARRAVNTAASLDGHVVANEVEPQQQGLGLPLVLETRLQRLVER